MFFDDDSFNAAASELDLPAIAYAVGIVGAFVIGWWLAS